MPSVAPFSTDISPTPPSPMVSVPAVVRRVRAGQGDDAGTAGQTGVEAGGGDGGAGVDRQRPRRGGTDRQRPRNLQR